MGWGITAGSGDSFMVIYGQLSRYGTGAHASLNLEQAPKSGELNVSRWLSLCLLCACLSPVAAQAASYDCTQATTPAEIAVCANPGLNRLDEELAVLYRSLLDELPARQADRVQQDQRSWLKARNSCGAEVRCLRARYQERIARLNQY